MENPSLCISKDFGISFALSEQMITAGFWFSLILKALFEQGRELKAQGYLKF